jgi:hypothetical protein
VAFDLSIFNLWNQDTVTGIYPTMNTTTGRPNDAAMFPAPIPAAQRPVLYANGYTSGALLQRILNHIAATPGAADARYKLPQLYQSPRSVKFGFRMMF